MKTLDQNKTYTLALDHVKHGEYWLELIERSSGRVKILTGPREDIFDGVKLTHALKWMIKQNWQPMYKAGVM